MCSYISGGVPCNNVGSPLVYSFSLTHICHLHVLYSPAPSLATTTIISGALLLACGSDPFQLVDAGVAAAAALSGGAAPRSIKQLPASLDGFGW